MDAKGGVMMYKLKGWKDKGGNYDAKMKGRMQKGALWCKLKGRMDKGEHYDVEMKGEMQKGGHYDVQI